MARQDDRWGRRRNGNARHRPSLGLLHRDMNRLLPPGSSARERDTVGSVRMRKRNQHLMADECSRRGKRLRPFC